MAWNPDQYLKFAQPRLRPALDLLSRVALPAPRHVVDLGCGTGNVTRLLAARWPQASITGVDASAEMLAKAHNDVAGVRWVHEDLARWRSPESVDVIFSNAALHWLPAHDTLLPSLAHSLRPSGVLAVQMPSNFAAASHTAMAETALEDRWSARLGHLVGPAPVAPARHYHQLLEPLSRELDIWETEYLQVLDGQDPVKEWTKGTWLTRFLRELAPVERPEFEEAYARRLRVAYPPLPSGKTLFPFKRLFIVLTKA